MGFIRPQAGTCRIGGRDCMADAAEIQAALGYIPGEIALPDEMTGEQFLRFMAAYRGMRGSSRTKALLERFELDPRGRLKKMSKGMKQKIGIVCAFMHDPAVLILDVNCSKALGGVYSVLCNRKGIKATAYTREREKCV